MKNILNNGEIKTEIDTKTIKVIKDQIIHTETKNLTITDKETQEKRTSRPQDLTLDTITIGMKTTVEGLKKVIESIIFSLKFLNSLVFYDLFSMTDIIKN